MDLPCIGAKLKKDFEPPFTCGGDTRRSIIKTFVRDHINKRGSGSSQTNELIRARIAVLKKAWSDTSGYSCLCQDGATHSLLCCTIHRRGAENVLDSTGCEEGSYEKSKAGDAPCQDNFLPPNLNISFDEISGDDVIRKITEKIPVFLREVFTDNDAKAFRSWNDPATSRSWAWEQVGLGEAARSNFLYTSHRPITNFSVEEVGSPFKHSKSMWYTCAGLISQVMMTMPMAGLRVDGQDTWTASSVLSLLHLKFDPAASRSKGSSAASSTEEYVEKLLSDSFSESSTFWHYAARHAPSESLACEIPDPKQFRNRSFLFEDNLRMGSRAPGFNGTAPPIPMHGYAAFSLGTATSGCFCGWPRTGAAAAACTPPAEVCLHLFGERACTYNIREEQADIAWNLTRSWVPGWACPEMDLSDAWGVATNTYVSQSSFLFHRLFIFFHSLSTYQPRKLIQLICPLELLHHPVAVDHDWLHPPLHEHHGCSKRFCLASQDAGKTLCKADTYACAPVLVLDLLDPPLHVVDDRPPPPLVGIVLRVEEHHQIPHDVAHRFRVHAVHGEVPSPCLVQAPLVHDQHHCAQTLGGRGDGHCPLGRGNGLDPLAPIVEDVSDFPAKVLRLNLSNFQIGERVVVVAKGGVIPETALQTGTGSCSEKRIPAAKSWQS